MEDPEHPLYHIDRTTLNSMSDEALSDALISVRGIGPWSVHMYMMMGAHRPDVLPVGDLGFRKGVQRFFSLKKEPDAGEIEKLTCTWSPYRSVACWYMWRLGDVAKVTGSSD